MGQFLPVGDEFVRRERLAALGQDVDALFRSLPFAGSGIEGQDKIFPRFITGFLDSLEDVLDSFFIAGQIGSKTAFITDGSS